MNTDERLAALEKRVGEIEKALLQLVDLMETREKSVSLLAMGIRELTKKQKELDRMKPGIPEVLRTRRGG